jgi:large subunit ribosomal protein L16
MGLKSFLNLKSSKTLTLRSRPMHRIECKGNDFSIHNWGPDRMMIQLCSLEYGRINDIELVSLVKLLNRTRSIKKCVYIRAYPYLKLTKKPAEVRMGKGKGKFDSQTKPIFPGAVLFEVRFPHYVGSRSSSFRECKRLLNLYSSKFRVKTKVSYTDL